MAKAVKKAAKAKPAAKKKTAKAAKGVSLLIGTRKGAWLFHSDTARRTWRVDGPTFLGNVINHVVRDDRGSGTLLMAAKTGHLGPTIFRSTDKGKSWVEAKVPPAFRTVEGAGANGAAARAIDHSFWLSPGHASEPRVWWAGTSPPGLFVSTDDGVSWERVDGFNENAMYGKWCPPDSGTPDGALLNQIVIDPRDASH